MPKLLIAFASAMLLLASSGIWKANAATITNAGTLSPLTKSYTPVEEVGWTAVCSPCLSPWLLWLWLRLPVLWLCLPSLPRITATATGHTVIMATAGATKEQWPPQ